MRRVVCIGCSKEKAETKGKRVTPAELYTGQLFQKRVEYAERRELPWVVLSAKYGVWRPSTVQKTYELAMADLPVQERVAWHLGVAGWLANEMWEDFEEDETRPIWRPGQVTFELHAGKDYCEPLAALLEASGFNVERPCAGLGIGQQLQLYTKGRLAA